MTRTHRRTVSGATKTFRGVAIVKRAGDGGVPAAVTARAVGRAAAFSTVAGVCR